MIVVFGPSIVIFVLYSKIVQAIKESCFDQKVPRSVAKMIFATNLVYIMALFPFGANGFYILIVGHQVSGIWDATTTLIALVNYVMNPILYCVFQKKYHRAVFDLVGIKFLMTLTTTSSARQSGSTNSEKNSKAEIRIIAKPTLKVSPMMLEPAATTTPSGFVTVTDTQVEPCPTGSSLYK